jgi:hypothetical protein
MLYLHALPKSAESNDQISLSILNEETNGGGGAQFIMFEWNKTYLHNSK